MVRIAHKTNNLYQSKGFSMIEVLVTVLILAIGLLGLASMQVQALKGSADGGQRGKAVWLAQEIAERMRANPDGVQNGDYLVSGPLNCAQPANLCGNIFDGSSTVQATANCTANQLAEFDLWQVACPTNAQSNIQGNVTDFLTNAELRIACQTCASAASAPFDGEDFEITISWSGRSGEQGVPAQSVNLVVRP